MHRLCAIDYATPDGRAMGRLVFFAITVAKNLPYSGLTPLLPPPTCTLLALALGECQGMFRSISGPNKKGKQMAFRPLHDRVLVRRVEAEEKTAGGIIIPDTAKE